MGRRQDIECPPLAKLGTWKFTFSRKTNPFGCQAWSGAEVAGGEGKGIRPGQMLPPAEHLPWPRISRHWLEEIGKHPASARWEPMRVRKGDTPLGPRR